ncbi:uncharacterized protein [Musca autumnalis]|uniref:uncharacterized protein n=1 Tax=Musca autumnalis TaxID=221902 RepID=UPI003CF1F908
MDPSRHHEYIANNDERSRVHTASAGGYYSRDIPDIASQRYYGSTAAAQATTHPPTLPPAAAAGSSAGRSHSNSRIPCCDCTTTPSGARITCNNCRLNPNGDMWPNASVASASSSSNSGPPPIPANDLHLQHRGEYRQMVGANEAAMRSGSMRQNAMYMQQQQPPPGPAPPPNSGGGGPMQHPGAPPPSTQNMMQTHSISRTNYWPQNPSSTSQHYGEEHIHGPGPGQYATHHHPHVNAAGPPPPPHQATTQTQIDISITRRTAAAPAGPSGATSMDAGGGNLYGQYKAVTHPSHSGSSYPPPQPSSSNPLHHHQQRGVSAIGGPHGGSSGQTPPMVGASNTSSHYITKEQRVYQTKYSSTTTTTKIAYNATATSTAVYDNHHPQHVANKTSSSAPAPLVDHHVINPSNLPASKEQHPSPNYARKCPQMYSPETAAEQSTAHHHHHHPQHPQHHHNLYMPTPQFSSDKFSRASPQQVSSDYTKFRESPSGAAVSPYMDKYSHIPPSPSSSSSHLRESPQFVTAQQQQQQQTPRNSNAYNTYNSNNPPPNHLSHHSSASSKVHPPEMSPIIMKQSPHPHYQYSRSPLQPPPPSAAAASSALPPSASHAQSPYQQIPPAPNKMNSSSSSSVLAPPQGNPPHPPHSSQRYLMDSVKREDLEIYESSPQHASRGSGIYINPYNTPPPTGGDSCCKEVTPLSTSSSPYTTPNYRVESPQFYTSKYGKMSITPTAAAATDPNNKHAALLQQNTPPPSRAPSQRGGHPGQPAYYYDGNPHSAPSPAAATAASPSPSSSLLASSTTTSQTHIQHTEYVTTTLQQGPGVGGVGVHHSHHSMPPHHQSSSYPPSQPTGQHHQAASLRNNEVMPTAAPLPYERSIPPQNHAAAGPPSTVMKHSMVVAQQNSAMVPGPQNVSSVPPSSHHYASKISPNPAAASVGGANKNKPNYRELITRQLAMRNATSEEELNLQIIKKTLNVGAPPPSQPPNARVGGGPVVGPHAGPHTIGVAGPPLPPAALQQPQPTAGLPLPGSKLVNHHSTTVPVPLPRPAETSRIFIKQEDDKPSSSSSGTTTTTSPLDLSMRTVKTKADSTEYKYQQRRSTPNALSSTSSSAAAGEGRYTLPRVDSTPVFSVHAFEPGNATPVVDITGGSSSRDSSRRPSPHNSRHSSLERSRNYTPPTHHGARDIVVGPSHPNSVSPIGSSYPHPAERHSGSYTPRRDVSPAMMSSNSPHIKAGSSTSLYDPAGPCVIKSAPKTERDITIQQRHPHLPQARPSVLETNPYASVIKTEPKRLPISEQVAASSSSSTLAAVERLPPDTSIMPLPLRSGGGGYGKSVIPKVESPSPTNTSQGCERNPNFRKRHIQEYSHQMSSTGEPLIKQSRYLDSSTMKGEMMPGAPATKPIIPMRPADISVIAVNESNQHELMPERSRNSGVIASTNVVVKNQAPVIVNNVHHLTTPPPSSSAHGIPTPTATIQGPGDHVGSMGTVVCKQEPLTPTGVVEPTTIAKQEPAIAQSSQPRIRTKAELKGFTFNPPPPAPISKPTEVEIPSPNEPAGAVVVNIKQESPTPTPQSPPPPIKIKEEEPESTVEELQTIPGLEEDFSESQLLDFGWSNTCNNFVEQLITRPAKKSIMPGLINKTPVVTTTTKSPKEISPEVLDASSQDIGAGKSSKLNNFSNIESAADTTTRSSFPHFDGGGVDSTSMRDPLNSPSSSTGMMHKKLNKLGRDKKRYQQEKRLAERLQSSKDSSSESEDELDKRKTERLKKPLMKAKNKMKSKSNSDNNSSSNQMNDKNQFSDCGSDSSSSEEEAETEKKEKPAKPMATVAAKKEMPTGKLDNNTEKSQDNKAKGGDLLQKIKEEPKEDKEEEVTKTNPQQNKEANGKKEIKEDKSTDGKKSANTAAAKKSQESDNKKPAESSASSSATSATSSSSSSEEGENAKEETTKGGNKVQATNNTSAASKKPNSSNLSSSSSPAKSPTLGKFKIGLNTMTRSKLKQQMEAQIANSKVLRNDKIIRNDKILRNSTTKSIKRKYGRTKYVVNNVNSYLESGGLSRESGVMKSTRLKAKLERKIMALNHLKGKDKKINNKLKTSSPLAKESAAAAAGTTPNKNGKNENLHDPNVLELYRFKRALKVPPSLISIKHAADHKIAASLPDLERHASALEAKKKKKNNLKSHKNEKSSKTKSSSGGGGNGKPSPEDEEPKSIIDLLHSRVTKASGLNVSNKSTTTTASKPANTPSNNTSTPKTHTTTSSGGSLSCVIGKNYANSSNNCGMFSETSQTTESSELQMLPPLKPSSDEDDDDDNESATSAKKRHFSIFETTVLPTKTRTESKMQQKRENIREIFVGDDRPASAPPEMTQTSDSAGGGIEKMTYEQKYEQFLQQMNIVISSDKSGRFSRTAGARKLLLPSTLNSNNNSSSLNIKQEEVDTESTSVMDPDELKDDQKSETTHTIRKKRGKYLRRKGSSGFDYIRKKKKPSSSSASAAAHLQNHNSNNSSYHNFAIKTEKMEVDEYEHRVKTEDDVSREIQKWVLNKGVGQSTMHKAARQGYIDVVVYCLERMNMNPDQKDNAGYTPLHEACTNGWLDIARVLLQYGANHSAAAHSGIRPLHEASENDHEEIVRLLLAYGADPLLATYSGQTPLMLASSTQMRDILNNHLIDVQNMGPERKPWKFNGPWEIYDPSECGYNVFEGAPNPLCDTSRAPLLRKRSSLSNNQNKKQNVLNTTTTATQNSNTGDATSNPNTATTNNNSQTIVAQNGPTKSDNNTSSASSSSGISSSNNIEASKATSGGGETATTPHHHKGETTTKTVMDKCAVVLDKIDHFNSVQMKNNAAVGNNNNAGGGSSSINTKSEILVENSDSDGEMFEFEEADILLPPLYLLKDEGTNDKWVLLSDLCNLLKVKSKDTLLNKIYPQSSSAASAHKSLMRELKMSDFLEKATCLQLLCAGEKINICASKVVLIKYNENVRNLLGVNTILMKF